MKKILSLLLCAALLTGCSSNTITEVTAETQMPPESTAEHAVPSTVPDSQTLDYVTRFSTVTEIVLSDSGITVDGGGETDAVFTSHDIIYYEDRDTYESGNPYGEGTAADRHSADEAAAHTVVNIAAPGTYRVSGKLSAGQIRIDLGEDACENSNAVVELILENADITCTVAPAILFLNTYECDGSRSAKNAKSDVDTSAAGANLILEGENTVSGSYVAKIFKDKDGEKKLWKQDGAIYSYMSMNVFGPGSLELNAANEGMDTELHLTLNGGNIRINSGNDGINTNEDDVSVTTINGGNLEIFAGLGAEGDGIDSNGYLVINGGTVMSAAHPASDAGLDSSLGSYVNGGTVIAFGSTMDWAESASGQVTMNLQFAAQQKPGSVISVTDESGTEVFSFTPDADTARTFSGIILSAPTLVQGNTYHVFVDGTQMAYTGTDVGRGGPGGFGGGFGGRGNGGMEPGELPEGFEPGQMPELPEGETFPAGFDPTQMGSRGQHPDGEDRMPPEGFEGERPENPEPPALPEGETFPEGELPELPQGGFGGRGQSGMQGGEARTGFYMNDMVNSFSGVAAA